MSAISGTRRAMKEMSDGTIRVQIDIDPACRAQFLSLFPNIDMPVALAPLVADFEQRQPEKPKGGELAKLAGQMCNNPVFMEWCGAANQEQAAEWVRSVCDVESRAELDHNPGAEQKFHQLVRIPFLERAA